jgi:D-alanyl-D-alanine carboxypeptidase
LTSCSGDKPVGIEFSNSAVISPGLTAELLLTPSFENGNNGKVSKSIKHSFSEAPLVSTDNPEIRILSVTMETEEPEISCRIIIRASESMLSGDTGILSVTWGSFKTESQIQIKKQPSLYLDGSGVITDPTAIDAMINKSRSLPADYIPTDLARIGVPTILTFEEVNHLRKPASEALSSMFAAARKEKEFILTARSGYRSYKTQVSLFNANVRAHGREYADKFSAQPGSSEHQSGLAMDITAEVMNYQLDQDFGETAEGQWTAENAHRFGFIIRYPEGKEDITGYAYEPWHLRYVGKVLSEEIYNRGLTLEEYYRE